MQKGCGWERGGKWQIQHYFCKIITPPVFHEPEVFLAWKRDQDIGIASFSQRLKTARAVKLAKTLEMFAPFRTPNVKVLWMSKENELVISKESLTNVNPNSCWQLWQSKIMSKALNELHVVYIFGQIYSMIKMEKSKAFFWKVQTFIFLLLTKW